MTQVRYVCGFLVSMDGKSVVLIQKARPEWQRGRLNGVGGKIEEGETPLQAMRREFREETRVNVDEWEHRVTIKGKDTDNAGEWEVLFFRAVASDLKMEMACVQRSDEPRGVFNVERLPPEVIPNLRWLIPLCLDPDIRPVVVEYA